MTKNAISVTVRDRAKLTKVWNHNGNKSIITIFFKNSKFHKQKSKWPPWLKNANLVTVRDEAKQTKIWDHMGYKCLITNIFKNLILDMVKSKNKKYFQNSKFYKRKSKWPTWTKVLISETVKDRAKRMKIWDDKGYNM